MPGPADRALVADDDDVAGDDPALPDRLEAGRLRVEDPGRAAVVAPLVAGQLHDAAVRRERAAQDRQAADRLDRRLDRDDDLLALASRPPSAAIWAIVRPSTVGSSPWRRSRLSSSRMTSADPAGVVHVGRGVAAARPHVGDDRRPVGDRRRTRRCSSGIPNSWAIASRWRTPFVEPPVAATEAIAFSSASRVTIVRRADVVADERPSTSSPAARAASSLSGSSAGMPLRPAGERPEELHRPCSSCWP